MENEENNFRHESYGNLRIARTSGGATTLFGTDLTHKNTIRMTINLSELTRKLNHDWYHPYKQLIEIELSPLQFSEAITNMNTEGIPCTIRQYNGERVEECPYTDKNDLFIKEFSGRINSANKIAKNMASEIAQKLQDKKPLNQTDKKELLLMINKLQSELGSNMDYTMECCQEQVNKTVTEAKAEIESYIANKINTLGLKALREESQHLVDIKELED